MNMATKMHSQHYLKLRKLLDVEDNRPLYSFSERRLYASPRMLHAAVGPEKKPGAPLKKPGSAYPEKPQTAPSLSSQNMADLRAYTPRGQVVRFASARKIIHERDLEAERKGESQRTKHGKKEATPRGRAQSNQAYNPNDTNKYNGKEKSPRMGSNSTSARNEQKNNGNKDAAPTGNAQEEPWVAPTLKELFAALDALPVERGPTREVNPRRPPPEPISKYYDHTLRRLRRQEAGIIRPDAGSGDERVGENPEFVLSTETRTPRSTELSTKDKPQTTLRRRKFLAPAKEKTHSYKGHTVANGCTYAVPFSIPRHANRDARGQNKKKYSQEERRNGFLTEYVSSFRAGPTCFAAMGEKPLQKYAPGAMRSRLLVREKRGITRKNHNSFEFGYDSILTGTKKIFATTHRSDFRGLPSDYQANTGVRKLLSMIRRSELEVG